jgi:hypothetical protein
MLLSDFFKRSPKKEPPQPPRKEPVKDDPFGSPEMQKKRYDAAMEFLGILQTNFLSQDGKDHAGTVLSVAAWLAGTSLYRSMKYKHQPAPGVVMLSDEVNEAWPRLMNLFMYYCQRNGIELKPEQFILTPPEAHKPEIEIFEAQKKFQDRYNEIMQKYGLDYLDGARAGMIVCSIIFQYHCTRVKDIDLNTAAGMISMGVVAGAKTVPPPLGLGPKMSDHNPNRLVLGERDVAIQDALDHGGTFIDLNPEILKTLQQSNIDPYIIYEQALRNQIEKKIPRIDFVKANVDELFEEWKSKSERQAPHHVRLIVWLKNNARTHGYEQHGNSWILNA